MSETPKKFENAKDAMDPRWSAARESIVGQRLARRIRQRERGRRVMLAGGLVVVLTTIGVLAFMPRTPKPALQFADGSIATALVPETRLVARVDRPDETT